MGDVIAWPARVKPPAGPPWSVTDADRQRRQTTTDAREQSNADSLHYV